MIYLRSPDRVRARAGRQDRRRKCIGNCREHFVRPKARRASPRIARAESLRSIRTKPDLQVELVAAEPLVASPVAIDLGRRRQLWVCEMFDYPTGADRTGARRARQGSRTIRDGDGNFDKATMFLDNLPFPTGVTAWGRGVLICAAPDILYAEDTDGDGKADKVEKLFSGFGTENYQARVNSLHYGLDDWVYGCVRSASAARSRMPPGQATGSLRQPRLPHQARHGRLEPATGLTQQGRVRDDWGNWFGCDNSRHCPHYPLDEHYLRRNPHVPHRRSVIVAAGRFRHRPLFPISRRCSGSTIPDPPNTVTAALRPRHLPRHLLGEEYYGQRLHLRAGHNLVHRLILERRRRADVQASSPRTTSDESEFFASTDNWFRPVQVRTGPDGALYIVDMYRYLIEHPRWIPPQRLAELDVRAGAGMGRIYRLKPKDKPLREVRDLSKLATAELAAALDSPNGTDRDRVHVELLVRHDTSANPVLEKLANDAKLPQVRVAGLSALDGLDGLNPQRLASAVRDLDAHVRAHAIKLCEPLLQANPASLADALLALRMTPLPSCDTNWRSPWASGTIRGRVRCWRD